MEKKKELAYTHIIVLPIKIIHTIMCKSSFRTALSITAQEKHLAYELLHNIL